MVHLRSNATEPNPNPLVNFITALPGVETTEVESARQYLRALAAQVRPLMQAHGFTVNSLEEYECNNVFAGRNWNNGEVIELVLRRRDGTFLPTSWLLSTLCHELAHIKHMNHSAPFQALWKQLRNEVRALQDKGFYGDGYWSSGTRLRDSAVVVGDGQAVDELPEFMCGGAQSRSRPPKRRRPRDRQRKPGEPIASLSSGRQTEKRRKAGARVTSKYAFTSEGSSLMGEGSASTGTGFRKQAGSKRAREERALAAERRMQASKATVDEHPQESGDETEEFEFVGETDSERRRNIAEDDNQKAGSSWLQFDDDFVFFQNQNLDIAGHDRPRSSSEPPESDLDAIAASGSTSVVPSRKNKTAGMGNFVRSEIEQRKKEALGLAPVSDKTRILGGTSRQQEWACHLCTLINQAGFLACSACGTPKQHASS